MAASTAVVAKSGLKKKYNIKPEKQKLIGLNVLKISWKMLIIIKVATQHKISLRLKLCARARMRVCVGKVSVPSHICIAQMEFSIQMKTIHARAALSACNKIETFVPE